MPAIAWLNGVWQAPEEARVPVLDRGFMFGDAVYEVVPVYRGKPFTLDRHLTRLDNSLDEVRMSHPMTRAEWTDLLEEAVSRAAESPGFLYIQVTRGVAATRSHEYPQGVSPTVLVMAYPAPMLRRDNVVPYDVVTLEDFRWSRGHIKTVSLIAAGMLKNEAIARGAQDAILIRDGRVTEATASNIFVALDGKLVTPPKSSLLLHGITRDLVIELCIEGGIEVEERQLTVEELHAADEIMITSAGHEAWPVGRLDGETVGNGEGGLLWQQVDKLFQTYKSAACP